MGIKTAGSFWNGNKNIWKLQNSIVWSGVSMTSPRALNIWKINEVSSTFDWCKRISPIIVFVLETTCVIQVMLEAFNITGSEYLL